MEISEVENKQKKLEKMKPKVDFDKVKKTDKNQGETMNKIARKSELSSEWQTWHRRAKPLNRAD